MYRCAECPNHPVQGRGVFPHPTACRNSCFQIDYTSNTPELQGLIREIKDIIENSDDTKPVLEMSDIHNGYQPCVVHIVCFYLR